MVGPSQTGKTWILNFIKHFSFINPGHALRNVLFLHMAEFTNFEEIDHEGLQNVCFHPVKNSMSNNELKVDEEIIKTIDDFKKKIEKSDNNANKHSPIIMDDIHDGRRIQKENDALCGRVGHQKMSSREYQLHICGSRPDVLQFEISYAVQQCELCCVVSKQIGQ